MKASSIMKNRFHIGFLILFILFGIKLSATQIDREKYRDLKDGMEYTQGNGENENNNDEWWRNDSGDEVNPSNGNGSSASPKKISKPKKNSDPSSLSIPTWLYIVIYVILGIGLAYLIYLLFFKTTFRVNKSVKVEEQKEELAVDKSMDELQRLLAKSLQNKNYRDAVRIYFIFVIKQLRDRNWINWKKEKTNHHYLFEFRDRKHFSSFSEVIFIFEQVWFGKREITEEQYQQIVPFFDKLLNAIKNDHE